MNWKTPVNLLTHFPPCFGGLLKRPDPALAKARLQLLFTGRFDPIITKLGYKVENRQQLYCYWDLQWEAIVFRGGWTNKLPANPVIIDIGANYGTFGFICRKRFPRATIIGFEPIPELAEYCQRLGCYDKVHAVALSNTVGEATLFLDYSLGITATLGGNKLQQFKDAELRVKTGKLDEFNLRPDFIKVDVDGGEIQTITGGLSTFKSASFSVIECWGEQRHSEVANLLNRKCKRLYTLGTDYLFY